MHEQDESTTPFESGFARTMMSFHEREARRTLMQAAGKLSAIRADLWNLHVSLEMPEEQIDAIAEGRQPETVAYAIQGCIECVNRDSLDGAIKSLEDAALLSAGTLLEEWKERQKEQAARSEGATRA